ncbi:TIM barrel protein [Umezawaea tangerina]|uniref:Sugar phosphate isomerase/epimerase n=1 Tax=Umezawaea tangerina TaxID=84725 RepID=A0A2T0TB07_9PSEU|nr:TIM barrel protein [Umezawaea tangerina]PRY42852.1 sugar phosphate isomerase/epimerase [Umezawaea tangerina]
MTPLWTVDAGGTGTAVTGPGGRRRYGSVNPASGGHEAADAVLRTVFADLAADLDGRVGRGWIATATVDPRDPGSELERLRRTAERAGLRGRVVVSNDALPWLVAPPLSGRGVAVVCGTGSGFLAGDGRSAPVRVGSCEYLGSDEGSAYDLGLSGLRAAVRALDGRGPDTVLAKHFGVTTARDLARLAFPKAAVAALAPTVCRAWLDGDPVATRLVADAIGELGLGVRAAAAAAGLEGGWTVAAGGGVFLGCPEFLAEFEREVLGDVVVVDDPNTTIEAALEAGVPAWALDDCAWTLTLAAPPRPAPRPAAATGPIALGLCLAAWGGDGLPAALDAAREIGVDAVDLPTDTTTGLVDADRWAADAAYRSELRETLADLAVTCVSNSRDTQLLLGPHGPHTDPVLAGSADEKRAHALRHAEHAIRIAADLGAPQVRLMFGVPDLSRWLSWWHSDVSWADNVEAWLEAATPVLKLAAEHGVRLLVEPHPKQVAYDPDSTRRLLDAADVRLCLDVANLAAVGYDPVSVVRGWGNRLGAAHAKDLQRWTGTDQPPGAGWSRYGPGPAIRFRALGSGDLPWPAVVAALLDEGFRGVLYVEHEDALLPREQSAANSARLLRSLLPDREPQGRTW